MMMQAVRQTRIGVRTELLTTALDIAIVHLGEKAHAHFLSTGTRDPALVYSHEALIKLRNMIALESEESTVVLVLKQDDEGRAAEGSNGADA